ncbi:hypothetical protein QJS66_11500 [Kocuria rhizophila]|nr:hypothetical protein QJS66_11500 [Kocuria rhizophila]
MALTRSSRGDPWPPTSAATEAAWATSPGQLRAVGWGSRRPRPLTVPARAGARTMPLPPTARPGEPLLVRRSAPVAVGVSRLRLAGGAFGTGARHGGHHRPDRWAHHRGGRRQREVRVPGRMAALGRDAAGAWYWPADVVRRDPPCGTPSCSWWAGEASSVPPGTAAAPRSSYGGIPAARADVSDTQRAAPAVHGGGAALLAGHIVYTTMQRVAATTTLVLRGLAVGAVLHGRVGRRPDAVVTAPSTGETVWSALLNVPLSAPAPRGHRRGQPFCSMVEVSGYDLLGGEDEIYVVPGLTADDPNFGAGAAGIFSSGLVSRWRRDAYSRSRSETNRVLLATIGPPSCSGDRGQLESFEVFVTL